MANLVLKSDVSNDLRQNADQIGSVAKALTEFVWNSVQYQPEAQAAEVKVTIVRNRGGGIDEARIEDNGRGMSAEDLQTFFTMHAENQDRLMGRVGRGRFGTGAKAAAMAVAEVMEVDTVKDGERTVATLRRDALTSGSSEIPIPSHSSQTDMRNGTRVTLRKFRTKRFKEETVKSYLQRALGRILIAHRVTWEKELLTYSEPPHRTEWVFEPPEEYVREIGNVRLFIRLSESWLSEADRGITITSNEVTHECNFLGDYSASPQAGRIYGRVDVPLLEEEDDEGRPAYTSDRTMMLNRENLRVNALLSWINDAVGDIVKGLEAEEKAQQDRARQDQLRKTAKTIEEALNRRLALVFENLERKVNLRTSASPSPLGVDVQDSDISTAEGVTAADQGNQEYIRDDHSKVRWRESGVNEKGDMKVRENEPNTEHDGGARADNGMEANAIRDPLGDKGARIRDTKQGSQKKLQPKGSFRVIPKSMGPDAPRAYYAATYMTIYVNTDHPQIAACGDPSKAEFKILLAECAASEFALALTAIRIDNGDPDVDPGQWPTIITAIRREASETGAELAQAIAAYKTGAA
jgi:histidine kinase/DNA gyrase B/HSP90-like ATPase